MRINEFAGKNAVSVRMIRYYIQIGLLKPRKQNGQLDFSEAEFAVMEKIEKLKAAGMHLKEIEEWFSCEAIAGEESAPRKMEIGALVMERLEQEERRLRTAIGCLEREMLITGNQEESTSKGIPLEMLSILCCPVCKQKLQYENAKISGTELWRADVSCECGYHAVIRDGIFLSKDIRTEEEIVPIDKNRETYGRLKPNGVNQLQKNFHWILKRLMDMDLHKKVVFENFVNTICFLSTGLPYLEQDAFYIIADSDEMVIKDIKQRIEAFGGRYKILFLVQNSLNYPLRDGSVDVIIDYFHSEIVQSFGLPTLEMMMLPYIHGNSRAVGIYTYVKKGRKTLKKTKEMFPASWPGRFVLKEFQNNFQACGLKIEDEVDENTLTESVIESYEKGDILGEWCFYARYR